MPQCSAGNIKMYPEVHDMQVVVKKYHISFSTHHCRHGKRQAPERPVLGNLSKSREAGYKDSPKDTGSCSSITF